MTRGAFDLPRRQEAPRRVRGGLKLQGDVPTHEHWLAQPGVDLQAPLPLYGYPFT